MRDRLLLALVVATAACGGSDGPTMSTPSKTVDVATVATVFSPNLVQINAGDSVRFTIVPAPDGDGHDVTFDAKPGAPPNIPVTLRGTVTRGFATRGSFHYNCFVHPNMSGDITVQ